MRICLLCNRGNMYSGGQGIYLYYLSREFQRLGHDVHVLVGPPYPHIAEGIHVHKINNLNFFEAGKKFLPAGNPFKIFTPLNLYEFIATRLWMFPEMFSFGIRAYRTLKSTGRHSGRRARAPRRAKPCGWFRVAKIIKIRPENGPPGCKKRLCDEMKLTILGRNSGLKVVCPVMRPG